MVGWSRFYLGMIMSGVIVFRCLMPQVPWCMLA